MSRSTVGRTGVVVGRYGAATLCLALAHGVAQAQWRAITLHPAGAHESVAFAASPTSQAGFVHLTQTTGFSALWSGSAASAQWLGVGIVYGMNSGKQVGGRGFHAALWEGTEKSFVDLHPGSFYHSSAHAVAVGQQVGTTSPGLGDQRAALWHGTAASYVDLHPPGFEYSAAWATDGQRQGGQVQYPGLFHAALWSGSAASMMDMNPDGARSSAIYGMAPGQQVGYAQFGSLYYAAAWNGTAASHVSMHPTWAGPGSESRLLATTGSIQAGWLSTSNFIQHAGIWFNDRDSFLDLHALLPPGLGASAATGVAELNGQIWVSGWAQRNLGYREAFLWTNVPAPGGAVVLGALPLGLAARRRRRSSPGAVG